MSADPSGVLRRVRASSVSPHPTLPPERFSVLLGGKPGAPGWKTRCTWAENPVVPCSWVENPVHLGGKPGDFLLLGWKTRRFPSPGWKTWWFPAPGRKTWRFPSPGHKALCLKIENDPKNKNSKEILSKQILKKNENLGKKELAATARQRLPPPQKKTKFRGAFWKYSRHNCPFNP